MTLAEIEESIRKRLMADTGGTGSAGGTGGTGTGSAGAGSSSSGGDTGPADSSNTDSSDSTPDSDQGKASGGIGYFLPWGYAPVKSKKKKKKSSKINFGDGVY